MNASSFVSFSSKEWSLLDQLDRMVQRGSVREQIDAIVRRVVARLTEDRTRLMAWEAIPLSVYGEALPAIIRSSWVFVLRGGATTGAERHPNSHQRMMSYRGSGDLQTGGAGRWESHSLVSETSAGLERRWVSVPPNVWHQAVVPRQDWTVVSFHTAAEEELIEERPDPAMSAGTRQKRYLGAESLG